MKNQILSAVFLLSGSIIYAPVTVIEQGLSYNDVLLVPQRSNVQSRSQVCTKTRLTKKIELNNPIISANMDTVTKAPMAIEIARLGGIGMVHRFMSIEDQAREVEKVKRYRNTIIENPLTVKPTDTLGHAKDLMHKHNIRGLLVADSQNKLVGMLTSRDIRFRPADELLVMDRMTKPRPENPLIVGKPGISTKEAAALLLEHGIEKLPLINDDGTIAGLITGKDIHNKSEFPNACLDSRGRLMVGAAIGATGDSLERAQALIKAGVDVLVIDIAHGHSDLAIDMLKKVKSQFPTIDVIAGNVCTAAGTRELIEAGADAVKVGIGPGSICTTRIVAGSGYPQLSAVINCAQEAAKYGVPVIADGGIATSGDIVKAIAGGASTVMLGSLLAGTEESPGAPFIKNGKKYKVVRGMASFGANLGRTQTSKDGKATSDYVPEGVEALVAYKGSVAEIIHQLIGGLCSGISYCGVTSVEQLCGNGTFVQITAAGVRESNVHDVEQLVS